MKKIPHDPNELLALVDEKDKVIGKAARKEIHDEGKLHREASVLIVNNKNEILLQTRTDNGKLDYSASGHFPYDQDYLSAAVREVVEELGLKVTKESFKKVGKFKLFQIAERKNNRFVSLFEVHGDYRVEDMKIDPAEVKSIRYYTIPEIRKLLEENKESGGFFELLGIYLEKRF